MYLASLFSCLLSSISSFLKARGTGIDRGVVKEYNRVRLHSASSYRSPAHETIMPKILTWKVGQIIGAGHAHTYFLISQGELSVFTNIISLLIFTVPRVVLGAQVGVMLSNIINRKSMGKFVGALFIVLAILIFLTILR